ncbi:MAG TPA: UbiA family prenyltransferase [Phycisphaerae bacterium]|nr:UbiA family prenyltransferase [Phycisphaerae bacterium]
MSRLRAFLQLVRLPNVFTALADVIAGYWLFSGTELWSGRLAFLMLSSACLYVSGIVFNDLCDLKIDRCERPNRPLPSGVISPYAAFTLGATLAQTGILITFFMTVIGLESARLLFTALLLLASIILYNFKAKATPAGPWVMGICRALNLYLGMSPFWSPGLQWPALAILASFFYVTSFSYFGRQEANTSNRRTLITGVVGVGASLLVLGLFAGLALAQSTFALVLWLGLCIHIGRVGLRAIRNPHPSTVQYAMKTFIFCIIVFDATIVSTAQDWPQVLIVLSLLIPALVLGRWIYST